jgi:hypothetical protein
MKVGYKLRVRTQVWKGGNEGTLFQSNRYFNFDTIWRMRIVCSNLKATKIYTGCVMLIAFPL